MSAFKDDHAENMKNPEYAYEFGRTERELEIIKLLEDRLQEVVLPDGALFIETTVIKQLIKLIREDNK